MDRLPFAKAERLVSLSIACIKGKGLYPDSHPAVLQPLRNLHALLSDLLLQQPEVAVGLNDGVLFVDRHLFVTNFTAGDELTELFEQQHLLGITFYQGVTEEELGNCIGLLSQKGESAGSFAKRLEQAAIRHIRIQQEETEPEEEQPERARGAYTEALQAVRGVFEEAQSGRIPSSQRLLAVVEELVDLTLQNSTALVGLAMLKDYDNYTFNHSVNVGLLAMALGAYLGLPAATLKTLGTAGLMHDVGKTMIDRQLLNKPGRFTADEMAEIRRHPEFGVQILEKMPGMDPTVCQAVLGHHIQHNREGYPPWAKAEPFDLLPAILAVADCYDAMTTLRVYQQPMTPKDAIDRMQRLTGSVYDPELLDKFVEMMGSYPVGTLVRLDTNETAVVFRPNPQDAALPVVKVILDAAGTHLPEPRVQALAGDGGNGYAAIVAVMDPLQRNINVAQYLS